MLREAASYLPPQKQTNKNKLKPHIFQLEEKAVRCPQETWLPYLTVASQLKTVNFEKQLQQSAAILFPL